MMKVGAMGPQFLTSLSRRRRQAELMDQEGLGETDHVAALRGLARINWLSRSDAILWPPIESLARANRGATIRVLDLATGGGDVPLALARRALRSGVNVRIEGCDVSQQAVEFARRNGAAAGLSVSFFTLDVLNEALPAGYDVVTCSLFLHHLDEANAESFMRKAADATGRILLINDLVRGRVAFALAWTGCHLLTRSPVVRHDGPVSVAAAFSLSETRMLAQRAGLHGASLVRRWPRRFLLSWSR
jgi:2-polyprenyl-3-methyl-5-hydroxy-6-metoxy-1,4-benzoquinol methylase